MHFVDFVELRNALGQVTPEPKVRPEAMWAYMAFDDWAREHTVKPLRVEQMVWSRTHRYAGTLDLLAEVDGRVALVDFKTSKAIYAEAHLQNAAYQVALAEMGHERAEVGYIVRVPKLETDPAFEVAEVAPVAELFPVFQSVLAVWQWWHAEEVKSLAAWKARRDAAQAQALLEMHQVRFGIQADAVAGLQRNGLQHGARRTLAIGAGHRHHRDAAIVAGRKHGVDDGFAHGAALAKRR